MNRIFGLIFLGAIFLGLDSYAFQGVERALDGLEAGTQLLVQRAYWGLTGICLLALAIYHLSPGSSLPPWARTAITLGLFTLYLSKVFVISVLLLDEGRRLLVWGGLGLLDGDWAQFPARSVAMARAGWVMGLLPLAAITYGVVVGAHDYRVRKLTVSLPNLPPAFEGFRLVQLSDIHAGTFWNKQAVARGVERVNQQEADVVLFTGDLVNNRAAEMEPFMDTFSGIRAKLGVFSVLGNHDYGDYVPWPDLDAKRQNLRDLMQVHARLGWRLLMNEHEVLERAGQQLAIIGIENWGAKGNFPQYGKLDEAIAGAEDVPVKLLLSHDPSHWEAQVIPQYPEIDLTLSGHTHGMQFGLEWGRFRWSPVQYMYPQWAGLYRKGQQYLHVNRGFGYLGFPGRIGMPPEITVITLKQASS